MDVVFVFLLKFILLLHLYSHDYRYSMFLTFPVTCTDKCMYRVLTKFYSSILVGDILGIIQVFVSKNVTLQKMSM